MYGVYCDWMSVWSDVRLRGDKVRVTGSEEYTDTKLVQHTHTSHNRAQHRTPLSHAALYTAVTARELT